MAWPSTIEEIYDSNLQAYLRGELTLNALHSLRGPAAPWRIVDGRVEVIPELEYRQARTGARTPVYPELISVIIPACNEGLRLRRTLENYRANFGPRAQVEYLVIDDASTDDSCQDLGPDVQVLRQDRRIGSPSAKLVGAGKARGQVLLFSDAHHCVIKGALAGLAIDATTLQGIVSAPLGKVDLDESGQWYVTGNSVIVPKAAPWSHWGKMYTVDRPDCQTRKVDGATNVYAMTRETWGRLGGLCPLPGLWGGQEYALAIRALAAGIDIWMRGCLTVGHWWKKHWQYEAPPLSGVDRHRWWMYGTVFSDLFLRAEVAPILIEQDPRLKDTRNTLDDPALTAERDRFLAQHRKLDDEALFARLFPGYEI